MRVLALDSSQGLDLALYQNGETHILHQGLLPKVEGLLPGLQASLAERQLEPEDIQRLVVVTGPGNYTTLRAGIVAFRTWAMVKKVPLFVTGRLDMMIYAAARSHPQAVFAPCLNVKQGQWYAAVGKYAESCVYQLAPRLWTWDEWLHQPDVQAATLVHLEPVDAPGMRALTLPHIAEAAAHWGSWQALDQQVSVHQVQPFYIRPAVNEALSA